MKLKNFTARPPIVSNCVATGQELLIATKSALIMKIMTMIRRNIIWKLLMLLKR